MGEPAIEVVDVAKRFRLVHEKNATLKATIFSGFKRTVYEEFWALDGVSFAVPEGETFGIIGHNGSGKSTLLKCMSRIYRPNRGQITMRGRVSALLELGAGFHPELSGRENVYLNGSILGMSKRDVDRRFDGIVEFAGLEQFIDTPVKNYSSGMFVRLGFSIAITVEPDILLVDEVLAVGDESFQQRCLEKFADLRASGRTVVIVTHSLDTVRNMCDRAAWLDHGNLLKEGNARDVVDAYLDSVRDDRRAHEGTSEVAAAAAADPGTTSGFTVAGVSLLDDQRDPVDLLRSGEAVTVSIDVDSPADEVVCLVLTVYRSDGVRAAGQSHRFSTGGAGRRTVEYLIPRCMLAAGVYDVNVQLQDEHRQRTHAVRRKAARLDVVSDDDAELGGVVALNGTWCAAPAADNPSGSPIDG